MQKLSVRYSGRVQGVGFRASVVDLASSFKVTGRVANVWNGSVDLQAEGEETELIAFHQAILQRLSRNIASFSENWSDIPQAHWDDFGIAPDLPT